MIVPDNLHLLGNSTPEGCIVIVPYRGRRCNYDLVLDLDQYLKIVGKELSVVNKVFFITNLVGRKIPLGRFLKGLVEPCRYQYNKTIRHLNGDFCDFRDSNLRIITKGTALELGFKASTNERYTQCTALDLKERFNFPKHISAHIYPNRSRAKIEAKINIRGKRYGIDYFFDVETTPDEVIQNYIDRGVAFIENVKDSYIPSNERL